MSKKPIYRLYLLPAKLIRKLVLGFNPTITFNLSKHRDNGEWGKLGESQPKCQDRVESEMASWQDVEFPVTSLDKWGNLSNQTVSIHLQPRHRVLAFLDRLLYSFWSTYYLA